MSSNTEDLKQGYAPKEVAEILGISIHAVYRRIDAGVIVAVKLHARRGCPEDCHCPIRIPRLPFGAYLAKVHGGV